MNRLNRLCGVNRGLIRKLIGELVKVVNRCSNLRLMLILKLIGLLE